MANYQRGMNMRKLLWGGFGVLVLILIAVGIWGCTEEGDTYNRVTNPCCDDTCYPIHTCDDATGCTDPCAKYEICFEGRTFKILKSEWEDYKARGAVKGKCPKGDDDDDDNGDDDDDDGDMVLVCHFGQNIWVLESLLQEHLAHGDTRGKCPIGDDDDDDDDECDPAVECCVVDGKTFICHFPPGNPGNYHTLHIGSSAVPAHLSNHPGDHCGYCLDPEPCFWCD
jgi:hypothetical protein